MEGSSRSRKMSEEQVRRLITARVECNHFFTTKFFDRKAAWATIKEKAGLGEFSIQQIKIKWANLTTKYKVLVTPPTGGATENGEQTPDDWEHFNQLHDFMATQHIINPPLVVNSCGIVVQNSHNIPNEAEDKDAYISSAESGPILSSPEAGP
ncbi:uncharacterized protein LOC135706520 [Ochlerotatus camptorhynchus]|uniref:uncharacterized protein LOC135706520 n=1 Tax=Ochlerotatus camptorhynchus TaxID=644619 RepID=UPI0031DB1FF1